MRVMKNVSNPRLLALDMLAMAWLRRLGDMTLLIIASI